MTELKILEHGKVNDKDIEQVIKLKTVAWPYPYESQKEWIKNNISDEDLHVFLMEDGIATAYLNLVNIYVMINNERYSCYGIGNVCARRKGNGDGRRLMLLTNDYIKNSGRLGLLLCHEHVSKFYEKCGWMVIPSNLCSIDGISAGIYVYAFNISRPVQSLLYTGKLF